MFFIVSVARHSRLSPRVDRLEIALELNVDRQVDERVRIGAPIELDQPNARLAVAVPPDHATLPGTWSTRTD